MGSAINDYIPPELVKVTTPTYRPCPKHSELPLGTYTYSVRWEGIPAATCSLTVEKVENAYQIAASASTLAAVDRLYNLKYTASTLLARSSLVPISAKVDHKENSHTTTVELSFSSDSREVRSTLSSTKRTQREGPRLVRSRSMTFDPISAAILARSAEWQIGETKNFDVYNGQSRYLISLTAEERSTLRVGDMSRNVFVLTPKVRNLTSTMPEDKVQGARVYLSADEYREVVRIESKLPVGSITVDLISFTASAEASNRDIRQETKDQLLCGEAAEGALL